MEPQLNLLLLYNKARILDGVIDMYNLQMSVTFF